MNTSAPSPRSYSSPDPQFFTEVEHGTTELLDYSISQNKRLARYLFTASLKVLGGIRHLTALSWLKPTTRAMSEDCLRWGQFSPRPYQLGQLRDETSAICVYALYGDYCRARGIDPGNLLVRAYPGWERPQDWLPELWEDIRRAADWQGTHFPSAWTNDDGLLLLQALREIDRPCLSDILEIETLTGPVSLHSA